MTFRVAIVGAHLVRVAKVLSLVKDTYCAAADDEDKVQFLPLVATFGSYDDEHGISVKYLANVTYHGVDGKQKGTSVAQFFDAVEEDLDRDKPKQPPISIVAIGIGIEDEKDVQQIRNFLSTLGGTLDGVVVECIRPNPEFNSMAEETKAFQHMDDDTRREATDRQIMGPGKMAKFVLDLLAKSKQTEAGDSSQDIVSGHVEEPIKESVHHIDVNKNRYACRICREILCGDDDLQDPPHVPARHQFSYRKQMAGSGGSSCQSLFLGLGLPWMGDISEYEGKFSCPYCNTKLGIWKWAGTQCSCGTWVTPAIQIPLSKVDVLLPEKL